MGPLFVLFGASTLLLWIFFIILCICVTAALENDSPGWATFSVGMTLAVLWLFTDFHTRYQFAWPSWQVFVTYLVGYFSCGILWSLFKWYLVLSARRERWDEAVRDYRDTYNVPKDVLVTIKDDERFVTYIRETYPEFLINRRYDYSKSNIQVAPRPDKSRIMGWMVYWPWSLAWSIFDDLITGIFRWVYRNLVGVYDGMANWMFRDVE